MKKNEASFSERQTGYTAFCYPDDEITYEPDRSRDIAAVEFASRLLLSARTDRVRHMRASVCLALLKGEPLGGIATHFRVTSERVRQIAKEIQRFETLTRGQ